MLHLSLLTTRLSYFQWQGTRVTLILKLRLCFFFIFKVTMTGKDWFISIRQNKFWHPPINCRERHFRHKNEARCYNKNVLTKNKLLMCNFVICYANLFFGLFPAPDWPWKMIPTLDYIFLHQPPPPPQNSLFTVVLPFCMETQSKHC